jgi:hypothetical protein
VYICSLLLPFLEIIQNGVNTYHSELNTCMSTSVIFKVFFPSGEFITISFLIVLRSLSELSANTNWIEGKSETVRVLRRQRHVWFFVWFCHNIQKYLDIETKDCPSPAIWPCITELFHMTLHHWAIPYDPATLSYSIWPCITEIFHMTLQRWAIPYDPASLSYSIWPCISELFHMTLHHWAIPYDPASLSYSISLYCKWHKSLFVLR